MRSESRPGTSYGRQLPCERTRGRGLSGRCSAARYRWRTVQDGCGWARCRRATTSPAIQPGARLPSGGWIGSGSRPARAISHEVTELEFQISPAPSSSRPKQHLADTKLVKTPNRCWHGWHQVEQPLRGPLIAAQPPGALDCLRGVRDNASGGSHSGSAGSAPPGGCRPGRRRRGHAEFRCCPAQASSRSRNVRPVPAPRARSGTDHTRAGSNPLWR
jgi:hypothetical protein